jgi:hypothetical protein
MPGLAAGETCSRGFEEPGAAAWTAAYPYRAFYPHRGIDVRVQGSCALTTRANAEDEAPRDGRLGP